MSFTTVSFSSHRFADTHQILTLVALFAFAAFLLEKYTTQILQQHAYVPYEDECETICAWALACSRIPSNERERKELKMLKSKRAAAQLSSPLSHIKALCDTRRQSDSSVGPSRGVAVKFVFCSTRNRGRRKRKRSRRQMSDAERVCATNG